MDPYRLFVYRDDGHLIGRATTNHAANNAEPIAQAEVMFDPETIAVLSAALDEAWERLLQSGSECTRPAYARAMREVIARRIIDMAQQGTVDQKELANRAVRFLAANYRLERKRPQGSPEMAVAPEAASEITGAASGHSPPLS
jgi:hypothetical protein